MKKATDKSTEAKPAYIIEVNLESVENSLNKHCKENTVSFWSESYQSRPNERSNN